MARKVYLRDLGEQGQYESHALAQRMAGHLHEAWGEVPTVWWR